MSDQTMQNCTGDPDCLCLPCRRQNVAEFIKADDLRLQTPPRREPCLCRDDPYGRNPDGECFCFDSGARCSCTQCQDAGRAGRMEW